MAQVMVNFRIDEDVKKNMEQACREMGLSMTAAFTIFATKVGREKRIPFEITAGSRGAGPQLRRPEVQGEQPPELDRKRARLEQLCTQIRRSLTSIHIAIPSSITGLTMERIRLLCGDELKGKAAEISSACKSLFAGGSAGALEKRDLCILDEYTEGLAAIAEELEDIQDALIPVMKSSQGTGDFESYERRLTAVSQRFDQLPPLMRRFLNSTAGGAQAFRARLRQAAAPIKTPYVLTALENLEALALRYCGSLEERTQARLESDYLQVLELALEELARCEREGGDTGEHAALCLRAVNVMSQVISGSGQARQEWDRRRLEAEVEALERLAAMRGESAGGITV